MQPAPPAHRALTPIALPGYAGQSRRARKVYTSLTFFSGRLRTGVPVAAKIAVRTAGVTTQIVGSPTPPQKSYDDTITVSTFGISAIRTSR